MGGAAIAAQAAGTGLSAYGSYTQGLAQKKYYESAAADSRMEAGLVERQGDQESTFAQDEGSYQTKMLGRKATEIRGVQKTTLAANGVSGSVTAADISNDTQEKLDLDKMAIKYNADMKSWKAESDAKMAAWNLRRKAAGLDAAGKEAEKAGKIGAFTSLLSGAGQTALTSAQLSRYGKT